MCVYSNIVHGVLVVVLWALGAKVCSAASSPDLWAARIMASTLLSQLMLSLVPPMPADTSHVVETSSGGSHLPSPAASQPSVILRLGAGREGVRNKCLSPF